MKLSSKGCVGQFTHTVLDDFFSWQKAQNVSRLPIIQHSANGVFYLGQQSLGCNGTVGAGCHLWWVIHHRYWIGNGVYGNNGATVKVIGKHLRVHGGRRNDYLKILSCRQHPLQQSQHKVYVQAPFVGFIYHHHRIAGKPGIQLHFLQQNTVGHDFDSSGGVGLVLKPHLVAHQTGIGGFQLLGNKLTDTKGCNTAGLGNGNHARLGIACFMEDYWQLGSFS